MAGLAGCVSAESSDGQAWLRAALGLLRHAPSGATALWYGGALGVAYTAPQSADQLETAQAGPVSLFITGTTHNVAAVLERFPGAWRGPAQARAAALLAAYRAHGLAPLTQFNGDFTIGVWDAAEQQLRLVTDRWSLRKVYYARVPDGLVFASEVKALLAHRDVSRRMDPVALAQALAVGYPMDDRTPYTAIRLVPGGHVLTVSLRPVRIGIEPYWRPRFVSSASGTLDEQADELGRRLEIAARRAIGGARRVAVPLSGGWDSRTVLGFARRARPDAAVTAYGIGHEHAYDVVLGRRLARRARVPYRFVPLPEDFIARQAEPFVWLTDGMASAHNAWGMGLRAEAAGDDVLLTGFFGDALLGFWCRLSRPRSLNQMEALNLSEHQLVFSEPELARLLKPGVYRQAKDATAAALSATLRQAQAEDARDRAVIVNMLQRQQRYICYPLVTFGSTVRVAAPFTDNDLVDLALRLPPAMREDKAAYLRTICRALPALAGVPDETHNGLPLNAGRVRQGLYWRWERLVKMQLPRWSGGLLRPHDRRAYAHYDAWMRQPVMRAYVSDTLTAGERYLGEWMDAAQVRRLIERHMAGEDLYRPLSGLLTLVLWCQQADRIPAPPPAARLPAVPEPLGGRLPEAVSPKVTLRRVGGG